MLAWCQGLARCAIRDTDTDEERYRKGLFLPVALVCWISAVLFVVMEYRVRIDVFGTVGVIVILGAVLVRLFLRGSLPLQLCGPVLVSMGVIIITFDVVDAAEMANFRAWAWTVLIMDMYLALNVPFAYHRTTLGLLTAWVIVFHIESAFRLGLYDIEHVTEAGSEARAACSCARPPCAKGPEELALLLNVLIVLYGDYYATRGFAAGLRSEQAKVLASVGVAEQVAASLADFDLAAAEAALDQAGGELSPLSASFRNLLANLASYRPYLPQSCFERGREGGSEVDRSDPRESIGGRRRAPRPSVISIVSPDNRSSAGSDSTTNGPRRSSAASISSPAADPMRIATSPTRAPHAPQHRKVTLLTRNRTGMLAAAQQLDPSAIGVWLAEEVDSFAAAVKYQGGVVDLLAGDHLSATFGAVKSQPSQRTAATHVAASLGPRLSRSACLSETPALAMLPHTAAVCSGRALCGDFGCTAAQRFMVIGPVSSFVAAVERCAAAWGAPALLDSVVHTDAEQLWSCRLCTYVRFPKISPAFTGLWEMVSHRMCDGTADEWMYELDRAKENPWVAYNAAIEAWQTAGAAAALRIAEEAVAGAGPDRDAPAAEGLQAVAERAREGAPPPELDLSAAHWGSPAPLRRRSALPGGAP